MPRREASSANHAEESFGRRESVYRRPGSCRAPPRRDCGSLGDRFSHRRAAMRQATGPCTTPRFHRSTLDAGRPSGDALRETGGCDNVNSSRGHFSASRTGPRRKAGPRDRRPGGPLGGFAGRLLPAGRPGRDDPDRRRAGGEAAGRGLLSRGGPPRGAPAGPARPARAGRILPPARDRRPAGASAPGGPVRGRDGRRADPDRGRDRPPLDEPDRSRTAGGGRPGARPDPEGREQEALGLDAVSHGRLRRGRRDGPARLRGVRGVGHVPRPPRPGRGLGRARGAAGGPRRSSWPA